MSQNAPHPTLFDLRLGGFLFGLIGTDTLCKPLHKHWLLTLKWMATFLSFSFFSTHFYTRLVLPYSL